MKKLITLLIVVAFCAAPASAVIWADDFESYTHKSPLPAPWSPNVAMGVPLTYGVGWAEFSVRPAGMIDSSVATSLIVSSNSGSDYEASRPIGTTYTDGAIILEAWMDGRSNAGSSNGSVIGLGNAGTVPDIQVNYGDGSNSVRLNDASGGLGAYAGYGTIGNAPTYYNTDLNNYNQWQHVRLVVDMVGGVGVAARLYKDTDQSTGAGPWQLKVNATGLSLPQITDVFVGGHRDYAVDEVSVDWQVPEPVTLSILALGSGLALLRRRR